MIFFDNLAVAYFLGHPVHIMNLIFKMRARTLNTVALCTF